MVVRINRLYPCRLAHPNPRPSLPNRRIPFFVCHSVAQRRNLLFVFAVGQQPTTVFMQQFPMTRLLPVACLCLAASLSAQSTMPPPADRQLARDIYQQFIEIKSGYSSGSTTPVAQAAAERLRAARFPDSHIFVGGPLRPP